MSLLSTLLEESDFINEILPARSRRSSAGKLARALSAYSSARGAYRVGKVTKQWLVNRSLITVTIDAQDEQYDKIVLWLLSKLETVESSSFSLETKQDSYWNEEYEEWWNKEPSLELIPDSENTHEFMLENHKYSVFLKKPEKFTHNTMGQVSVSFAANDKLIFQMHSVAAQQVLMAKLKEVTTPEKKEVADRPVRKRISLYVHNGQNGFTLGNSIRVRDIDSIILKEGQLESILTDLEKHKEAELRHIKLGIPYHRGYLFYGPPGTGKTSLAKALATHLDKNIYFVSLSDIESDKSFNSMVSSLSEDSILLLEDVDVFSAVRRKEVTGKSLSLSGLLNALDGVGTPHGLITIMTTNDVSKLDSAITRKGRVDLSMELTYLDYDQGQRFFTFAYDKDAPKDLDLTGIAPTEVIEIIKQNINDPHSAAVEMLALKSTLVTEKK